MKNLKKIVFSFVFLCLAVFCISNIKATEYEENLYKRIVPDGKNVTLKGIKPPKAMDVELIYASLVNKMLNEDGYNAYVYCTGEDVTKCKFVIQGENFFKEYDINVTYEEPTKNNAVEAIIGKIKNFEANDYESYYKIEDLELINYYLTSNKSELWNMGAAGRALKYSKDLRNLTDGTNISLLLDIKAGIQGKDMMYENAFGPMAFVYNGYVYGMKEQQGIHLKRVIYIPESTLDNKEAYIEAAQKRIDEYLGKKGEVEVSYGGLLSSIQDPDHLDPLVLTSSTDGNYYNVKVKGKTYMFYIMKGEASKLVTPTYLASDIKTDITVTSKDSSIPLDTSLNINVVNNDNIKNLLGTDNYKAYDIKLYSDAKGASIEKLENGKFRVSIPVNSSLNGKEVTVYYMNSENKLEEYATVVENNIATFETNHFSTYILAEKANALNETNASGENTNAESENTINPPTGDNILVYYIALIVSVVLLTVAIIRNRRLNNK